MDGQGGGVQGVELGSSRGLDRIGGGAPVKVDWRR